MNWLGFGARAWLVGLTAFAVPIAIHLLSRGRQRRVRVGSVRFLAPAETLRARRVRPSRLWLLALRCLLIGTLVMALAEPRLGVASGSESSSWLLVAPEVALARGRIEHENTEAYRVLDESLVAGLELRWLVPGIPRGTLGEPPVMPEHGLWSLLHEADQVAPPGVAFVILAPERESLLEGARAHLSHTVEWRGVIDRTENLWLERAVALDAERVALVVGRSDGARTRFDRLEIEHGTAGAEAARAAGVELARNPGGSSVALLDGGSLEDDDRLAVAAEAKGLGVAIFFAAEREQDVRYVRAGLEAVAAATGRPLTIRVQGIGVTGEEPTTAGNAALTFWLAPEAVATPLLDGLAGGGVLISDAMERFERCDALAWLPGAAEPFRVTRCGPIDLGLTSGSAGAGAIWSDTGGRPLLVGERVQAGRWLRFASRLNPDWTDLVLAPAFPAWLLELVEELAPPVPSARRASSDRRASAGQVAPRLAGEVLDEQPGRETPVSGWLWPMILIFAAGERSLALRSPA